VAEQDVVTLVAKAKDEATAVLGKVDRSMEQLGTQAKKTQVSFAGFNTTLGSLAGPAAAAVAIGAVVAVLGDATRAAIEDEKSQRRLGSSLEANVPAYQGATGAIEEWITAQQRLGFADDELRAGLARTVAVTHDVAEAQHVLSVAMDLARFKDISLEEASNALIKVEAGRYRGLQDLGIVLKAGASQEQALAAVMAVTTGAAEAQANTVGGKMQAAQLQMNEALESLGYTILPLVSAGISAFAGAITGIGDAIGALGTVLGSASTALTDWQAAASGAADRTAAATANLDAYKSAVAILDEQLKDGTITFPEYRAAVEDLTDAYRNAQDTGGTFSQQLDAVREALGLTTTGIDVMTVATWSARDAADGASASVSQYAQDLSGTVGTSNDLYGSTVGLSGVIGGLQDAAYAAANGLDSMGNAAGTAGNKALTAAGKFATLAAAANQFNRIRAIGTGIGPGVEGPGASGLTEIPGMTQADYGLSQFNITHPSPITKTKKKGGGKGGGGKSDAARAAEEMKKAVASAYDGATRAADSYFDRVHDRNMKAIDDTHKVRNKQIDDARKASQDQLKEALRAIDTELRARKAANAEPVTAAERAQAGIETAQQMRDLQEALADAQLGGDARTIRSASEALQNFQARQGIDALRAAQDAADAAAEAWAAESRAAEEEAEKARQADLQKRQDDEDARYLKAQKAEDTRWEEQRKKYDDLLRATAESTKATVKNANATQLLYLQKQLELAKASGNASQVVSAQNELDDFKSAIAKAPHKQHGGRVSRGGMYVVGENGPELFVPGRGGFIAPNGAGGGITVNVNGAGDPAVVARQVVLALKREADRQGVTLAPTGTYAR
jgi:hypothetical protein